MSKRPNILIFMTDQQRAGTVLPGSRFKAITPNIDKFREESVTFTEAHGPSPHCCPSRATFFTGLYPSQHGVWNNVEVPNALSRGLNEGVKLWSESLRESGYDLYFSGKWHVSAVEGPEDRGWESKASLYGEKVFHYFKGKEGGKRWNDEWARYERRAKEETPLGEGNGIVQRPGYVPHRQYGTHEDAFRDREVVSDAKRALKRFSESDAPWCLYAGTLGPHDPYLVPQEFLDLYPFEEIELPPNFGDTMSDKPALYRRTRDQYDQLSVREQKESLRHYLAFCSFQDALFGELLEELEVSGQADNTIVVYCSDHGDYAGEHGLWAKGLPCFKGAYHLPMIIRDPRLSEEREGVCVDAFVSLADFEPTITEWAGTSQRATSPGRSLVPLLQGELPSDWRDAYFTQSNGNELYGIQRSVTTSDWKFVYNGFDYDELYDLKNDPDESVNLIKDPDCKEIADNAMRRIWQCAYEVEDQCTNDYIMVALARVGPGCVFEEASP